MTDARTDPKPEARHRASQSEWVRITNEKMGPCRVCGRALAAWKMQLHHLIAKSLSGSDIEDNIVPLCMVCHGLIEAHDADAGLKLRASLTEAEIRYLVAAKGWDYLDRRYGAGPLGERDVEAAGCGAAVSVTLAERADSDDTLQSSDGLQSPGEPGAVTIRGALPPDSPRSTHCEKCGRKLPHEGPKEPARRKRSWRIAVPDDTENGKQILDDLVDQARLELAPVLGFDDDVPPYFVLVAALAAYLRGEHVEAA